LSNGGGNKRGILVSNSNIVTTRDANIYIAQPTNTTSTGSYVGIETADTVNNTGSIQLRATTVGVVVPTAGQSYTASDIVQTTPSTITNPSYLASPGIQIGPGTDLVTKTAGDKGFSTYVYPTTIYYGLRGNIRDGYGDDISGAWLWPGSQSISKATNGFPDPGTPQACYRIQQNCLLCGMSCSLNSSPGGTDTVILTVQKILEADIPTNTYSDTIYTLTMTGSQTSVSFYNGSVRFAAGDRLLLNIKYTGGNANNASDLTCQLDIF
jgi:hypothetical protein